MEGLSLSDIDLAGLSRLAGEDKGDALSISLPSLLLAALAPLPPRHGAAQAEAATTASLYGKGEEGSLVDFGMGGKGSIDEKSLNSAATDGTSPWTKPGLDSLDGFISGCYALQGGELEVEIFYFEKDRLVPAGSKRYSGDISSLEHFTEAVLPGILAWIARKPLGIIDVETKPRGAVLLDKSDLRLRGGHSLDGNRLFLFDREKFPISVSKEGYKDSVFEIDAVEAFGTYRKLRIEMTPIVAGTGSAAAAWAEASPESLIWKDMPEFKKKELDFHSALGRLVLSIPFSAISAGTFLLYSEAYSRSAASSGEYYASGAAMALCVSVSAGFIIDTAIRLVQVLRVSR